MAGLQKVSDEEYEIWAGTGTWDKSKPKSERHFTEPESYEEFITRAVLPRVGTTQSFQLPPSLDRLNSSKVLSSRNLGQNLGTPLGGRKSTGMSSIGEEEEEASPGAGVGLASQKSWGGDAMQKSLDDSFAKAAAATATAAQAGSSDSLSAFAGASSSSLTAEEKEAEASTFWAGVEAARDKGKAPAYRPAPVYAAAPGTAPVPAPTATVSPCDTAAGAAETAAAYCRDSTCSAARDSASSSVTTAVVAAPSSSSFAPVAPPPPPTALPAMMSATQARAVFTPEPPQSGPPPPASRKVHPCGGMPLIDSKAYMAKAQEKLGKRRYEKTTPISSQQQSYQQV